MSLTTIGIIGLLVLIVFLFSSMPIAFLMSIIGFLGFGYVVSWESAGYTVAKDIYGIFGSYSLSVVPLFILMGQITYYTGISRRLFDTAYKFLGQLPGGLAMATVGACAGFAAVCGSTNAAAATMATVAVPEMKRRKYDMSMATGVVAAGGSLGVLIPPSVVFIVYGIATEQSIGKLFVAGIIPGIMLSAMFVVTVYIWAKLYPASAPKGPKVSFKEKIASLRGVLATLVLFIIVMGGLFVGLFTPSEAGGIGAGGAILIGIVLKRLKFKDFIKALADSTRISCMVLFIIAGATIFGRFLAATDLPFAVAEFASSLPLPPYILMACIILIYLIGGCFVEILALILLTIPIFYPVIIGMGYDPIWFGVVIVLVGQMGVITPPVGINVFVVKGIVKDDVSLYTIFKGAVPFLIPLIVCVLILIPFPELALFILKFMG